jgi:tetratricopeptide (TPR) repeat protein
MELGEYDAAVSVLRQAAEMRPNASTAFNLGVAYRERWHETASEGDREEATRHLRRARGACNVSTELARCESIEAALNELESDESDESDD